MASATIAPRRLVADGGMNRERLIAMDDRFAEYIARMSCVRTGLVMESDGVGTKSHVSHGPPERDALNVACRSCNVALKGADRGRLLCGKCRANPLVKAGAPLIETMYFSSHPKFVLNKEKEMAVAHIKMMGDIARKECEVARHLAYHATQVQARASARMGDLNVRFGKALTKHSGAYHVEITRCNPRYLGDYDHTDQPQYEAVTVGGLGAKLHSRVRYLAVQWLHNLDAMIRRRFGVPLTSERGSMQSVGPVVENFANLIANRAVRLEQCGEEPQDPTTRMCAIAFQHVIKLENVRCEHYAAANVSADIRSMMELTRLVQEGEVPERCERLLGFLRAPCPELVKFLPQVAQQYKFAKLANALEAGAAACGELLEEWHAIAHSGSLVAVLDQAIQKAREWTAPTVLQCVQFHQEPREDHLPPFGWEDNRRTMASWSLVPSVTQAYRRTGLDAVGLRIVLMTSALWRISADERYFRPGVVRCDLIRDVVGEHRIRQAHAAAKLLEQLDPYMMGEPWRAARAEMTQWQGSHIEDDVRNAGSVLGDFSVQELFERYGRACRTHAQVAQRIELQNALVHSTTNKMIFKPASQYEDWFPLAVEMFLPILVQLRKSMGIAAALPSNTAGDILRLLPRVRDWTPEQGALRLGLVEVKNKPPLKELLLKLQEQKSPLVRFRRIKSVNVWELNVDALAEVLGK